MRKGYMISVISKNGQFCEFVCRVMAEKIVR